MSAGLSPALEDHVSLEDVSQARILLVDDLGANLLALDGLLRRDNVKIKVLHANSGREALELLLAEEIALAIIDVQMPVMNGFELAELMRGTERTRQIPIMFITAGAQNEQHRFRGYDAGAVDFLYKPIEPDILRQKVAVFLALYRSRRKIIDQRDELLRRDAALRESQERLRMALAASRTIGFDWDMRAGTVVYTPTAPDVLGLEAQVDEATAWRCVDPEDAALARVTMERAIAEGGEYRFDLHFRRPDNGALLWLDWRGKGERDASGRPVRALGVATDITERKRTEEALLQSREQLRAALKFSDAVRSNIVEGLYTIDRQGLVTYVNPAAEQLFGWKAAELLGRKMHNVTHYKRRDATPFPAEECVGSLALRNGNTLVEHADVFIRKDGSFFDVVYSSAPIFSDTNEVEGRVVVFRDVTERKQMEEQRFELLAKERALASERALRETEAELARVMRALSLGELATSIAHEVNQPLAGVVTNAEAGLRWLRRDPPSLEEAKESLANIAEDGARAGEVIRRLREFLKKRNPETTPLDINDVIQEAVALASAELVRRKFEIRIDLSDGLPPVRGDRIQLQQVILNLIMNGVEAMAATAVSKELVVSSRILAEDRILVAVRDSGAGISAEDMPRMFDPFYTTKPTGMGMGLSISRSILEAHGGRIWAEANQGPGLTVQFNLPIEKAGEKLSAGGGPS